MNVYQNVFLNWQFSISIGLFGSELFFIFDNRYAFGIHAFGSSMDILAAQAT